MKKFLSAVLTLSLALCALLPAAALAANNVVILAGVPMTPGDYLHVGATSVSSSAPTDDTGYAHVSADGKTLTLHDFDNQDKTYVVYTEYHSAMYTKTALNVVLEGDSKLTNPRNYDGITLNGDLTIDANSTGSLTIDAVYPIYGNANVTMNGGTLICNGQNTSISCNYFLLTGGNLVAETVSENHGIICGIFEITGGTLEATTIGNRYPIFVRTDLFTCSVTMADDVVVGNDEKFVKVDTDDALEKREKGQPIGRRTVRLGFPKEDPVVPDAPAAVPATGDNAMIALWAALGMLSAAGMIFISRRRAVK